MKYKEIKNPDSPLGKKDLEGRKNRVRLSIDEPRAKILLELFDCFIQNRPGDYTEEYAKFRNDILKHAEQLKKPLLTETNSGGLF